MSRNNPNRKQRWCSQAPLTPLLGPDVELQEYYQSNKKSSWEIIKEWFKIQENSITLENGSERFSSPSSSFSPSSNSNNSYYVSRAKTQDMRLLLGVLGCPLAPIPSINFNNQTPLDHHPLRMTEDNVPWYLAAAARCLKSSKDCMKNKNMYVARVVKMVCCETEVSNRKGVKTLGRNTSGGGAGGNGDNLIGCFVLWQMSPGMWSLELTVGDSKVLAGSNGKIVWGHTPWLGTHAAKGPQKAVATSHSVWMDPKTTASLFAEAECLGEKRIGNEDSFVLKVSADRAAVMECNEGPAEVIRHMLYGYFSQKSGLLVYMEDSHLTRVAAAPNVVNDIETVYWETTIYFRRSQCSMAGLEWKKFGGFDDVVFNVPGLSFHSFIPPADIFDTLPSP